MHSGHRRSAPLTIRVAIAEDDEEQRFALQAALEEQGFEVLAFEDGFELLDYLALGPATRRWPDALITDVGMPGRSGLEAIALAREQLSWSIPVFVVTGMPSPEVTARAAKVGVTLLLRKPLDIETLALAIRALKNAAQANVEPSDAQLD